MKQRTRLYRPTTPGILGGLRAFIEGIGFIIGTPSLWGYALVPTIMLLILGLSLGSLGVWGAHHAASAILGEPGGFWATLAYWQLKIGLVATAVVIALFLALALAQPLSGFALDAIVRAQERALRYDHWHASGLLGSLLMTALVTLFTMIVGVSVLVILFIVGLVFPPALAVTVPLKFLICSWMLAWNFLDYPLSRRGLGVRARLKWVGRSFGAFSAFGLAWAGLLYLTGGFALLLLPMGVAGATRLVVESEKLLSSR